MYKIIVPKKGERADFYKASTMPDAIKLFLDIKKDREGKILLKEGKTLLLYTYGHGIRYTANGKEIVQKKFREEERKDMLDAITEFLTSE